MDNTKESILQSIDTATLTPIVRKALNRDHIQLRDWHMKQLGGGMGNPVSVGLYRFEGTGQDGNEEVAWSVVLKILQSPLNVGWLNMGEGDDQTHWNYWKRELFVYQSGWLDALPEGLTAPHCYGTVELPGNYALLWLEDIRDSLDGDWTLDRYVLTARHLGRLSGMAPMPTHPWFSLHRNRQWLALISWQDFPWDHPLTLRRYPRRENNPFWRMLTESERFLSKLSKLPQTPYHGDSYPTNFMSRRMANGQEQTAALDWALMGISSLGDDLGQFTFGAHTNLKGLSPADITDALFKSYLAGLRDVGFQFDPQLARFGFVASAALRIGLFQVYLLGESIKQDDADGTVDHAGDTTVPDCFEVTMATEAYRLLESI